MRKAPPPSSLCLVALTGDEAPALHRAARESGADDVLLKNELVGALLDRLTAARTQRPTSAAVRRARRQPVDL